MSNISRKPIKIDAGVVITVEKDKVLVTGPKGSLTAKIPSGINVALLDGLVKVEKESASHDLEKFAGMIRAVISNMVEGVTVGFQKKLELSGVGYRAKIEGQDLVLNIGFTLPVRIKPLEGVAVIVEENVITVSGINKQFVGDMASEIRRVRPPDPYKAKGIKYQGEKIRRKVGKAAKAAGAAK